MNTTRITRKWLEPRGDADSFVRLDVDVWGGSDDRLQYTQYDLKIADCTRSVRLGFYIDAGDPHTKRQALAKLTILEDTLAQLRALIEVTGEGP